MIDLAKALKENSYPPAAASSSAAARTGRKAVVGYFIMGRSENSRNRVFLEEPDGIRTEAFDPSKMVDPQPHHLPPRPQGRRPSDRHQRRPDRQPSPITLKAGKTFEEAPPHPAPSSRMGPTGPPRISGLVEKNGDYRLSILKSADGDPSSTRRYFFEYSDPKPGTVHFIHTYACDGNPIPSFSGEPEEAKITGCINCFTNLLWDNLNADNKVSLYTAFIDLETGEMDTRILNKNQ